MKKNQKSQKSQFWKKRKEASFGKNSFRINRNKFKLRIGANQNSSGLGNLSFVSRKKTSLVMSRNPNESYSNIGLLQRNRSLCKRGRRKLEKQPSKILKNLDIIGAEELIDDQEEENCGEQDSNQFMFGRKKEFSLSLIPCPKNQSIKIQRKSKNKRKKVLCFGDGDESCSIILGDEEIHDNPKRFLPKLVNTSITRTGTMKLTKKNTTIGELGNSTTFLSGLNRTLIQRPRIPAGRKMNLKKRMLRCGSKEVNLNSDNEILKKVNLTKNQSFINSREKMNEDIGTRLAIKNLKTLDMSKEENVIVEMSHYSESEKICKNLKKAKQDVHLTSECLDSFRTEREQFNSSEIDILSNQKIASDIDANDILQEVRRKKMEASCVDCSILDMIRPENDSNSRLFNVDKDNSIVESFSGSSSSSGLFLELETPGGSSSRIIFE